jgi:hypothetical protein
VQGYNAAAPAQQGYGAATAPVQQQGYAAGGTSQQQGYAQPTASPVGLGAEQQSKLAQIIAQVTASSLLCARSDVMHQRKHCCHNVLGILHSCTEELPVAVMAGVAVICFDAHRRTHA